MAAEDSTPDDTFSKPKLVGGCFDNPWPTWKFPSRMELAKMMRIFAFSSYPKVPSEEELPVQLPVFPTSVPADEVRATWLGHASVLFHVDGVRVLCDPIFSDYCSPVRGLGPKRYRAAPCAVSALPSVDAVVISHTHYDHLDRQSVVDLNARFPEAEWFVPMNCASWMRSCGCQEVREMTWWEEATLRTREDVKIVFTPSQHWSGRGLFDRNKCLWGSFSIIGPHHRVYFAGDTGYCSAFKEIGRKFGPFDMAAIPIGAYCPRWFMSPQHVDPDEAVKIHEDIHSKCSFGMHWGTFTMTYEPIMEPKQKLLAAVENAGITGSFVTLNHGQSLVFNPVENQKKYE